MNDTELRHLYARIATRRAPAGRAGCVAPDVLLALVDGRLDEPARLEALRHVTACASCRADLELLRSAADASRGLGRRNYLLTLSVAASVVLVAGAALVWRFTAGAPEPLRGVEESVSLVRPRGDALARGPLVLVWHAQPQAVRYDVEVVDARGRVLFSAATRDTTLPLAGRADLVAGTDYYWWVQVQLSDGRAPRSRAERFRVRRP